ncbi:MAG: hypothetical protein WAV72_29095 [Bradyrhizobium sp.]
MLAEIWTQAGGDAAALDAVTLTGEEPQLPSSFRVAAGLRSAALRQPFGGAVENPGILGTPGDAARQSPAAMAGAALRSGGRPEKKNANPASPSLFCLSATLIGHY